MSLIGGVSADIYMPGGLFARLFFTNQRVALGLFLILWLDLGFFRIKYKKHFGSNNFLGESGWLDACRAP